MEVQVNVGHLFAFHVEEALEDQTVFQGIYIGDPQAVQGHAGGGAAPDAVKDLAAPDEIYDVPDHQEVIGETGMTDDVQLVPQPFLGLCRRVGIAAAEALFA